MADTPEDHQRKPNYVLVVPAINRQLLDLLFTLVFMFDDYHNRVLEYEKAGWREVREEYDLLNGQFADDPEWLDFLENQRKTQAVMADFLGLTLAQRQNLNSIPYWGTPSQLRKKNTASQPFLEWLFKWLYQDTSRTAHLSNSGIYRFSPFVLAEIVGGREQDIVESHIIQTFRFAQISRLVLIVLAIMTEISTQFHLHNYESIAYLWQVFAESVPEGKDMYDQRYKSLIDCSRT